LEDESPVAKKARENLLKTRDFKAALEQFPKNLGYEKALINHLIANEDDFKGALNCLPKGLQQMFVHAYQSYIFNLSLSKAIHEGYDVDIRKGRHPIVENFLPQHEQFIPNDTALQSAESFHLLTGPNM
jgi:TruD family tRNA pseudouridine synthase